MTPCRLSFFFNLFSNVYKGQSRAKKFAYQNILKWDGQLWYHLNEFYGRDAFNVGGGLLWVEVDKIGDDVGRSGDISIGYMIESFIFWLFLLNNQVVHFHLMIVFLPLMLGLITLIFLSECYFIFLYIQFV